MIFIAEFGVIYRFLGFERAVIIELAQILAWVVMLPRPDHTHIITFAPIPKDLLKMAMEDAKVVHMKEEK